MEISQKELDSDKIGETKWWGDQGEGMLRIASWSLSAPP